MKKYEEPIIDIIRLDANDIIYTSGCTGPGSGSDTEDDCLNGGESA